MARDLMRLVLVGLVPVIVVIVRQMRAGIVVMLLPIPGLVLATVPVIVVAMLLPVLTPVLLTVLAVIVRPPTLEMPLTVMAAVLVPVAVLVSVAMLVPVAMITAEHVPAPRVVAGDLLVRHGALLLRCSASGATGQPLRQVSGLDPDDVVSRRLLALDPTSRGLLRSNMPTHPARPSSDPSGTCRLTRHDDAAVGRRAVRPA
ncbi:hypothetical protein [Pseudonocardia sp.]|uniref:hypothetical protein n=1 Tax=Pseudonocardia sp. TaxID=60912 RepID=UPI00260967E3|nr:hypothetical protein [Pseudonocardia sp.]